VFPVLTDRLRIRPLRVEDLEDLYAIYSDPRVERWIGPHSREAVRVELGFHVAHQAEHGWSLWGLEALDTGRFVGDCGIQPLALAGPEVELGYDLHPEIWGRGLATEAAQAVVQLAFGPLAIDRLVAAVKPHHLASRHVLEKVGLTPAGEREVYGEPMLMYEAVSPQQAPPGTGGAARAGRRRPNASSRP
jgi:RimJ/RimL family protein N-acetyltransferase